MNETLERVKKTNDSSVTESADEKIKRCTEARKSYNEKRKELLEKQAKGERDLNLEQSLASFKAERDAACSMQ